MCSGEGPESAVEGPGIRCGGAWHLLWRGSGVRAWDDPPGALHWALFKSLKPASTRFSVVR